MQSTGAAGVVVPRHLATWQEGSPYAMFEEKAGVVLGPGKPNMKK